MNSCSPRTITSVFLSVVLIISLYGTLDAMNWPSEDANVVRNFGWNDRGKPVLGVVFTGDTEILAAENGEVIFTRRKNDTASRLPSPLGAWTALDHGDGLISIYSRCADEGRPFGQVEKQQPIAESGISGWSGQKGFYFFLYDRRERRWINPAMIITPLKDTRPPQILSVDLVNAEGVNTQMRNLGQGRYTILVTAAGANLLAPQRIICSINGAEVGALNFETISARDGVLMVYRNGLVPAKQIYTNFPAYEAADVFLNRGQVSMEIIVQDIAGNSRSSVSRMTVN